VDESRAAGRDVEIPGRARDDGAVIQASGKTRRVTVVAGSSSGSES
jgi:hypothetical protein